MRDQVIEVISNFLDEETDTIMDPFEDHVYVKFRKELSTSIGFDTYGLFVHEIAGKLADAVLLIIQKKE